MLKTYLKDYRNNLIIFKCRSFMVLNLKEYNKYTFYFFKFKMLYSYSVKFKVKLKSYLKNYRNDSIICNHLNLNISLKNYRNNLSSCNHFKYCSDILLKLNII